MNPPLRKIFYWSARLLAIFLITAAAQLNLSGIDLDLSIGEALLELLSRLWLSLALTAALILAWRWEKVGGGFYLLLAAAARLTMGADEPVSCLILIVSAAATGLLFLISAWMKAPEGKGDRARGR